MFSLIKSWYMKLELLFNGILPTFNSDRLTFFFTENSVGLFHIIFMKLEESEFIISFMHT